MKHAVGARLFALAGLLLLPGATDAQRSPRDSASVLLARGDTLNDEGGPEVSRHAIALWRKAAVLSIGTGDLERPAAVAHASGDKLQEGRALSD
jgi:hypothetical protein